MKGGMVAIRRLIQRLVMPDADSIHTRQCASYPAQALVKHQLRHPGVNVGQAQALGKDLGVKGIRVNLVVKGCVLQALLDGIIGHLAPKLQLDYLITPILSSQGKISPGCYNPGITYLYPSNRTFFYAPKIPVLY